MFEYTALVDAPVQRFTGIVTGSDPEDARLPVVADVVHVAGIDVAHEPTTPMTMPVFDAPVGLAALSPGTVVRPRSADPVVAIEPGAPDRVTRPPAHSRRPVPPRVLPAPVATPTPSFRPVLFAIVAAGVTAMWWLRRESHDR